MRKAFSLSMKVLPFLVFAIIALTYLLFVKAEISFEEREKKNFLKTANLYIGGVISNTKNLLLSQAIILSNDRTVREAYLENNPLKLGREFAYAWKELHERFGIEELHFFKYPNVNFYSFSAISTKPLVLSKRKDVEFVQSSFTPAAYFFICKRYPGLRASYPIMYGGKVLGAVSFGISMEMFRNFLKKPLKGNVFYLLRKDIFKEMLDKEAFNFWISKVNNQDLKFYYFHTNETFPENSFKRGFFQNESKFFFFHPLLDYKKEIIGYLGIEKDYASFLNHIYRIAILFTISSTAVVIMVFLICFGQVKYLENQRDTVLMLLDLIKDRKFLQVEEFCNKYRLTGDIFDDIISKIKIINEAMKNYMNIVYGKLKLVSQKAFTDALTGTLNRYALENTKKSFEKENYSLLMIDIDHFKGINDTYGHEAGDRVLEKLASEVKEKIRSKDRLFRYGGEEFVVILPETSKENAKKLAERIRKHIEETEIEIDEGKKVKITVSIGVAEKKEGEALEDVIKRADEAMYRAKESGRNRVSD